MEWVIALIVVTTTPLWMDLWWIPRCDAMGVQKAKDRNAREAAAMIRASAAATSPSRPSHVDLFRAQDKGSRLAS
jgi:hypothetical protein